MKNFGHTWQWGDNPEYTIDVCIHWDRWALPLMFDWLNFYDVEDYKCFNLNIYFLCFSFHLDFWRWKK